MREETGGGREDGHQPPKGAAAMVYFIKLFSKRFFLKRIPNLISNPTGKIFFKG